MRAADEKMPLHTTPYIIFSPKRGESERTRWYFQPINPEPRHAIQTNHPLLTQYMNPQNPMQKNWDSNYFNIMEHLPLLHFKKYVNTQTQEEFEYAPHYQNALNILEWCKNQWPSAVNAVEGYASQNAQPQFAPAGMQQPAPQQAFNPQAQQPMQQPFSFNGVINENQIVTGKHTPQQH